MKKFRIIALLLLVAASALLVGSPSRASDSQGNGPGTCITVYNYTSAQFRVTIQIPSGYPTGFWDIAPGEHFVLYDAKSNPIKSTNEKNNKGGNWWLHTSPDDSLAYSWNYDASRNSSIGCDGTWVATVTNP